MLRVYHSNQLELLRMLITTLMERCPLKDPLQQEVILVQSPGMGQWLQMQLAEQFGIAANITFPFPATFIWDMFVLVLPEIPRESAFSKESMTWKLLWLLPQLMDQPVFSALRRYLADDNDKCKLHQLAGMIADLFDQYLVYRADWLKSWEQGRLVAGLDESQQWQSVLWIALSDYTRQLKQPEWHRAHLYEHFIEKMNTSDACPDGLPERVFILGISTLPPVYLQALQALGRHIDIHLMVTNPCRHYWADIPGYDFTHYAEQVEQELCRESGREVCSGGQAKLSNPLLASFGQQARDYLYLLSQLDDVEDVQAFVDIRPDNLLQSVQHDILELQDSSVMGMTAESFARSDRKRILYPVDDSISFHVCHSPQREIEVLHDQLLTLLAQQPELTVRDIIVMVTDIDSYAPYIRAVFGHVPAKRYLPFTISDSKALYAHPILAVFITLLDLPHSRFTAEQVFALLETPALAGKFGIYEDNVPQVRKWIEESGIRWGMDDSHIRSMMLTETGQHTWQFGINRMLLGYAMESEAGTWETILPYDESSGLTAELCGKLAELLMQLSQWRVCLTAERTLVEWAPACRQLLDVFFECNDDTEAILAFLETQWQQIISGGITAGYPQTVPLRIVRNELQKRLDASRMSQRFLSGAVNFCTLMPMRSVPFKVVCLLGMNDGLYPSIVSPPDFDLMARRVRPGDRSRRDDDRYLFLEAILSAQQRLYISYTGKCIQDNSERYPSIVVSELMDYIAQSYRLPQDAERDIDDSTRRMTEHLCCWHPATPFSPENFIPGTRQQSYATEWLPVAEKKGQMCPDFSCALPPLSAEEITLDALMRFYRHPIRAFFQLRLGVTFMAQETCLPDEEPFIIDNLSAYQLNTALLSLMIEGHETEHFFHQQRASGSLPVGAFGEIFWQRQQEEMAILAQKIGSEHRESHQLELNINVNNLMISGLITHQPDGLLRWRAAELNAVDGLLLWLEHLAYCLAGGMGESRIYGRKGTVWRFAPLCQQEARQYFQILLDGYQQGLCQPLLLLAKSGWAWLSQCYEASSGQILWDEERQCKAQNKLLQTWQHDRVSGEGRDPYVHRLLPVMNPAVLKNLLQEAERYLLPLARHHVS